MAFSFETHALPLMVDMSEYDSSTDYPLIERIRELGLSSDFEGDTRIIELLREAGYITFLGSRKMGKVWSIQSARLTVAGLQQLDLWPSDNERGLYLAKRMSEAFDRMAEELATSQGSDAEEVSRLRTTATALAQFGATVLAQVVATKITG